MKKPSTIVRYAKPGGSQEDGPQEQECFEESPQEDVYPERDPEEPRPYIAAKRDEFTKMEFYESCKNGSPNYGLLVLAIGIWAAGEKFPRTPPKWAFKECRKLYERSQVAMQPLFSPSLGPKSSEKDEQLLERI